MRERLRNRDLGTASLKGSLTNRGPACQLPGARLSRFAVSHCLPGLNRCKPTEFVLAIPRYDSEKLLLDQLGNRASPASPYLDLVHGTNRRDFGGGTGEEYLVRYVQHFPRNRSL